MKAGQESHSPLQHPFQLHTHFAMLNYGQVHVYCYDGSEWI